MATGLRQNIPYTFRAQCSSDVVAGDYIYPDNVGLLKKARADSPNTMPCIGYVLKKVNGYAYCTREYIKNVDDPVIGPQFISQTEAGKLQSTLPIGEQTVIQQVATGLNTKLLVSIDNETTLRS